MNYIYILLIDLESVLQNAIGEFLGSLTLAILIWFIGTKVFKYPRIDGKWNFIVLTQLTDYNDFKDMELTYDTYLFQAGDSIKGTGEKVHEKSIKNPNLDYKAGNRTRITVSGNIKRSFSLRKDNELIIHIIEKGEKRESTSIHNLKISKCGKKMKGIFYSSIANQSGEVNWEKVG